MKAINNTIIEKLNRPEHFILRTDGGATVLFDIQAPGLHVLLTAYQFMKFTGEKGKAALLHHSEKGDFFAKTYAILDRAGLTRDFAPDVWGYIRELQKYASPSRDAETKANTNIQLFRFLQELLEALLYQEYLVRTGGEVAELADIFKKLIVAADSFVMRASDGSIQVYAGYPWFDQDWGRDTFISLNGILLATGRFDYAKSVFNYYLKQQDKDGMLPNRILSGGKKEYNTADASLWFIEAIKQYQTAAKGKDGDIFAKRMISAVNRIVDFYMKPSGDIYMDTDNLIVVPAQWTWMDTAPNGVPITPRNGKPVEIQALFYNALAIAAEFNAMAGAKRSAERYDELRKKVGRSINERFFDNGRKYPYDVIDGDPHGDAVRPNAVFLLSLSRVEDLLSDERKAGMLDVIEGELLTHYGLRSLSPRDPEYRGTYNTFDPLHKKDLAYHQGTVWPYLMSPYITAKVRAMQGKNFDEIAALIKERINNLVYTVKNKDTVPEVFSGDEPYAAGGAVSQAWSVAAMMEILDLLNTGAAGKKKKGKK